MNIKANISYDGSQFFGSQIQKDKVSVNLTIELALKSLNIDSKVIASGRTDRGVHAISQVINFQIPHFWSDLDRLLNSLNRILNPAIKIRTLKRVDESFHSRYSAKSRVYRYIFSTKELNPFEVNFVTFLNRDIDFSILSEAIREFKGVHNFEFFSKKSKNIDSYIREIYRVKAYKLKKSYYVLYFEANGFLRSQIRMMVQFLIDISDGKFTIENLKEQLEGKVIYSRALASPNGLYLAKIKY